MGIKSKLSDNDDLFKLLSCSTKCHDTGQAETLRHDSVRIIYANMSVVCLSLIRSRTRLEKTQPPHMYTRVGQMCH